MEDIKINTKDDLVKVIMDLKTELKTQKEIIDTYKVKENEEQTENTEEKEKEKEKEKEVDAEELDEITKLLLE